MNKLIVMTATLIMVVTVTAPVALAQTEPLSYVGYITSISGNIVLVEEDPLDPVLGGVGSNKGYFTVSGETEIFRLLEGDLVAPTTFEELEVGQLVSASYAGAILESYPPQGGAGSIVILAGSGEEPECYLPEGCDFDSDGTPEEGMGAVQYNSAV